jgi:hypothetical protein
MADLAFSSDKKTVLIIGAGASKEAGLPVGSELKKDMVGSTGERNACLQYSRWGLKSQRLSWALIQA